MWPSVATWLFPLNKSGFVCLLGGESRRQASGARLLPASRGTRMQQQQHI